MYRAVMEQVVRFLERACKNLDLIKNKVDPGGHSNKSSPSRFEAVWPFSLTRPLYLFIWMHNQISFFLHLRSNNCYKDCKSHLWEQFILTSINYAVCGAAYLWLPTDQKICQEMGKFSTGTAYPEQFILILHVFTYIFMLKSIHLLPDCYKCCSFAHSEPLFWLISAKK